MGGNAPKVAVDPDELRRFSLVQVNISTKFLFYCDKLFDILTSRLIMLRNCSMHQVVTLIVGQLLFNSLYRIVFIQMDLSFSILLIHSIISCGLGFSFFRIGHFVLFHLFVHNFLFQLNQINYCQFISFFVYVREEIHDHYSYIMMMIEYLYYHQMLFHLVRLFR
jgi:hypothetical protein